MCATERKEKQKYLVWAEAVNPSKDVFIKKQLVADVEVCSRFLCRSEKYGAVAIQGILEVR